MTRTRITIEFDTNYDDGETVAEELRHQFASDIWLSELLPTSVTVDGRKYDDASGKLSQELLSAEARRFVDNGQAIQGIKQVREDRGIGLAEAKAAVDAYRNNQRLRS